MARRRKTTARANWSAREYLVDALAHYEALAVKAESAKVFGAALKAKDRAVAIRAEIDQLDAAEQAREIPADLDDRADQVLAECRSMRAAARAGRSYVAAKDLLKLEAELVELQIARRDAQKKEDPKSVDEILAKAQSIWERLPEAVRARSKKREL